MGNPLYECSPDIIRVYGDWHANTVFAVNQIIRGCESGIRVFLHVGDFGLWATRYSYIDTLEQTLKMYNAVLFFIDGNHEDYNVIHSIEKYSRNDDGSCTVKSHIFYLPRGTVWSWNDIKLGALGGAISVDREKRRYGIDYFPDEAITMKDVNKLASHGELDILLTHDAPVLPYEKRFFSDDINRDCEENMLKIRHARRATLPRVLIHGHYHHYYTRVYEGTRIYGLDSDMNDPSFNYIDIPIKNFKHFINKIMKGD